MQITVHRGTREIGGSCVQLTANGYSILLDAGSPLGNTGSHVDLSSLDFDDVFISHPHQDHYGLIESLDASKTVHIGALAKELINVPPKFIEKKRPLKNTFKVLTNRVPIDAGPFRITPYLMDHSSIDAYGFLVEAEGKKVYYSGDFRTHGCREGIYRWFTNDHPEDVDVLLMEGTMMGRDNLAYPSEDSVKEGMIKVLRETEGPCFLVSSGQHIDRLCRAYAACQQVRPKREFVTDLYTGFILYQVSKTFPGVPSILTKPDVKVLTDGFTHDRHKEALVRHPEYFKEFLDHLNSGQKQIAFRDAVYGRRYFLKISYFSDILEVIHRKHCKASVVYSQWNGYLLEKHDEKQARRYKEVKDLVGPENFHEIHTSGHADREALQQFARLIKPKTIIPIHTEKKEAYAAQFAPFHVTLLEDGQSYCVQADGA